MVLGLSEVMDRIGAWRLDVRVRVWFFFWLFGWFSFCCFIVLSFKILIYRIEKVVVLFKVVGRLYREYVYGVFSVVSVLNVGDYYYLCFSYLINVFFVF